MKPHKIVFKTQDAMINTVVKKIKEGIVQVTILNNPGSYAASFKEPSVAPIININEQTIA